MKAKKTLWATARKDPIHWVTTHIDHTHVTNKNGDKMLQNTFIANLRSKELHTRKCYWGKLIRKNRGYFDSLKDGLYEGYDACGRCLPEHNLMIHHGLLLMHKLHPSVEGEYVLPGMVLSFSKEEPIKSKSLKISIELNQKCFEVLFQGDQNDYELTVNGSSKIFNLQEQDMLKRFWATLSKKFAHEFYDIQKDIALFGKIIALMLTIPKPFKTNEGKTRTPGQMVREALVRKAFEDKDPVGPSVNGKTASYIIKSGLDDTSFVQRRRFGPCVFTGESVQGWWTADWEWKKSWCIVGGENGDGEVGAGGTADLFGDIDVFVGWFYKAVDHDMCDGYEGNCFGPCTDEFLYTTGEFLLSGIINSLCPNQDIYCNGNNPPDEMKITPREIQQGHYSYLQEQYSDQEQHPMAGRKIGTPSDWKVDFDTKEWKGDPVPDIEDITVIPNPFSKDTDATIEFKLIRDKKNSSLPKKTYFVTIKLYYKKNTNVIRPVAILSLNVDFEENIEEIINSVNWDGRNESGIVVKIGDYTAEFFINGLSIKKYEKLITFVGGIATDNLLKDISISPNPFSVKHMPTINFSLEEDATVSAYIYHQNWLTMASNTLIKDKKYLKGGPYPKKWDCTHDFGWVVPDGNYKIKYVVNGRARVVEGLEKVKPGTCEGGSISADDLLKGITISPNPFSIESTPKIRFELKKKAKISIQVFHTRWTVPIKEIIKNKTLKAGPHSYRWNCRNENGVKSTNGEYKIKIIVNGKVRMIDHLQKRWEWEL